MQSSFPVVIVVFLGRLFVLLTACTSYRDIADISTRRIAKRKDRKEGEKGSELIVNSNGPSGSR